MPSINRSMRNAPNLVVFIGALPPPVTGMTAMTQVIVDSLRKSGPILCYNWSRGKRLSGWRWKAARIWGAAGSFMRILWRRRPEDGVVYYPISSGWGQLYDIAIILAARIRRYKIVVHHHVYSYITRRDWRMALLNRSLGADCAHVVHCEQMRDDFLARYPTEAEFLFLPPTIVSDGLETLPNSDRDRFTLGFLSNLTLAKGLDTVLDTFSALVNSERDIALVIAGPCHGSEERRMIDDARKKWPERVDYRGPVYGVEKNRFFADIDAFLFPTRYQNESWGIVLTEALAAKRPVIACRRGCVPWIVRDGCGVVVDKPEVFVTQAAETITRWIDDKSEYDSACQAAEQRMRVLREEADRQFAHFLKRIREI